jgi:hypothetical protein
MCKDGDGPLLKYHRKYADICSVFLDAAPSHLIGSPRYSKRGPDDADLAPNELVKTQGESFPEVTSNGAATWSTTSNGVPADILAFAHETDSSLSGDSQIAERSFTPVNARLLDALTKRYPSGTMWTFGENGLITPTEKSPSRLGSGRRASTSGVKAWKQQRESESESLRLHFPHARQLIFVPLFDAALERSTAG